MDVECSRLLGTSRHAHPTYEQGHGTNRHLHSRVEQTTHLVNQQAGPRPYLVRKIAAPSALVDRRQSCIGMWDPESMDTTRHLGLAGL